MELKELFADLISIDSTSSLSNEPVVTYIEKYFEGSDVLCHRLPAHEEEKFNLLLIKGEPSEEGLTLCGHMDTVPAGPSWTADPYAGVWQDGRLVGLGANDAGAAVVGMIGGTLAFAEVGGGTGTLQLAITAAAHRPCMIHSGGHP